VQLMGLVGEFVKLQILAAKYLHPFGLVQLLLLDEHSIIFSIFRMLS
jgi:hypothetical protein